MEHLDRLLANWKKRRETEKVGAAWRTISKVKLKVLYFSSKSLLPSVATYSL